MKALIDKQSVLDSVYEIQWDFQDEDNINEVNDTVWRVCEFLIQRIHEEPVYDYSMIKTGKDREEETDGLQKSAGTL